MLMWVARFLTTSLRARPNTGGNLRGRSSASFDHSSLQLDGLESGRMTDGDGRERSVSGLRNETTVCGSTGSSWIAPAVSQEWLRSSESVLAPA